MEENRDPVDLLKTIQEEVDSDIHPVLKMILDNIKPIGLAVGGIVAAVAVYTGVTSYQQSQHDKAVSELGGIMVMADQSARTEKLSSFAQSGPQDLRTAALLELAKVYTEAADYDKAAATWQAVADKAGMGTVAGMGEAKALMLKGDYAKAVTVLNAVKKNAGDEFALTIGGELAFAAEKAGQTDLAIAEYEALKAKDNGSDAYLDYKIAKLKAKAQS